MALYSQSNPINPIYNVANYIQKPTDLSTQDIENQLANKLNFNSAQGLETFPQGLISNSTTTINGVLVAKSGVDTTPNIECLSTAIGVGGNLYLSSGVASGTYNPLVQVDDAVISYGISQGTGCRLDIVPTIGATGGVYLSSAGGMYAGYTIPDGDSSNLVATTSFVNGAIGGTGYAKLATSNIFASTALTGQNTQTFQGLSTNAGLSAPVVITNGTNSTGVYLDSNNSLTFYTNTTGGSLGILNSSGNSFTMRPIATNTCELLNPLTISSGNLAVSAGTITATSGSLTASAQTYVPATTYTTGIATQGFVQSAIGTASGGASLSGNQTFTGANTFSGTLTASGVFNTTSSLNLYQLPTSTNSCNIEADQNGVCYITPSLVNGSNVLVLRTNTSSGTNNTILAVPSAGQVAINGTQTYPQTTNTSNLATISYVNASLSYYIYNNQVSVPTSLTIVASGSPVISYNYDTTYYTGGQQGVSTLTIKSNGTKTFAFQAVDASIGTPNGFIQLTTPTWSSNPLLYFRANNPFILGSWNTQGYNIPANPNVPQTYSQSFVVNQLYYPNSTTSSGTFTAYVVYVNGSYYLCVAPVGNSNPTIPAQYAFTFCSFTITF